MAKKNITVAIHPTKKPLTKELATKIEAALPDIKVSLGEKKFNKRVKKAAKLFTQGININPKEISKKTFKANSLNTNNVVANTVTA